MGYLDNSTITVEAILTKKGREMLARGQKLEITKFAVADDEVDYSLWTPTHPLGSAYYGAIIEGMPLVEAVPDETQVMRYKLVTLDRPINQIPYIQLGFSSIILTYDPSVTYSFRPTTVGVTETYTAILFNKDVGTLTGDGTGAASVTPAFLGDTYRISATAAVAVGNNFVMSPADVNSALSTSLTVIGNDTGATATVPVTVNPSTT